jgi:hypothetical protein
MDIETARQEVIKAFDPVTFSYYHKTDYRQSGFIDGMAWVGLLTGACTRKGDKTIAELGTTYLKTLLRVGTDARNYAKTRVSEDWISSINIPGYWFLRKKQAFEGPAGLCYAGLGTEPPTAKLLRIVAWVYGLTYPLFESNLNSIMTAFLIVGKKPPFTMRRLYESNPFYAAIAGIKKKEPYPSMYRYTKGTTETTKEVQPFVLCEPSSWPFRRNIYNLYSPFGEQEQYGYVPIWRVVGDYLQDML